MAGFMWKPQSVKWQVALLATLSCLAQSAFADPPPPPETEAQAAKCREIYNNLEHAALLAENRQWQMDVYRCINLGIDPPIKARNNGGIHPAQTVVQSRMPTASCAPFQGCLRTHSAYSSGNKYQTNGEVYSGGGSTGNIALIPPTRLSAPQFTGPQPTQFPPHLQGGGIVYFYDNVSVTPPCDSLVYSDTITNYYADCGATGVNQGYIASPPPTNRADVMTGTPITLNSDATFNFVDGGVVVLPPGFNGFIPGIGAVQGGDIIVIMHAGDLKMPAGTKLYPFPDGSLGSLGTHYTWEGWQPYTGPTLVRSWPGSKTVSNSLPSCPTQCSEPVPGTNWF